MNIEVIIQKTIEMSIRSDGFWARWLVHGVEREDIEITRGSYNTAETWVAVWCSLANEKQNLAKQLEAEGKLQEAEQMYRKSSLYYNLAQWIYPSPTSDKKILMKKTQELFVHADYISQVPTLYPYLKIDGHKCFGRVRVPKKPKGCVIILNPIDSSKEELYLYEKDFVDAGFVVVSFDGPGQGGTFVFQERKVSQSQIQLFVDSVISYAHDTFNHLNLYLIGTSTGGGCAIYGSGNTKVSKVVAVSPAIGFSKMHLSDYFEGRLYTYLEEKDEGIPPLDGVTFLKPVLVYNGGKDSMVPYNGLLEVYNRLPDGKKLIEYPDEAHCCNFRLGDIREYAANWFIE